MSRKRAASRRTSVEVARAIKQDRKVDLRQAIAIAVQPGQGVGDR